MLGHASAGVVAHQAAVHLVEEPLEEDPLEEEGVARLLPLQTPQAMEEA